MSHLKKHVPVVAEDAIVTPSEPPMEVQLCNALILLFHLGMWSSAASKDRQIRSGNYKSAGPYICPVNVYIGISAKFKTAAVEYQHQQQSLNQLTDTLDRIARQQATGIPVQEHLLAAVKVYTPRRVPRGSCGSFVGQYTCLHFNSYTERSFVTQYEQIRGTTALSQAFQSKTLCTTKSNILPTF